TSPAGCRLALTATAASSTTSCLASGRWTWRTGTVCRQAASASCAASSWRTGSGSAASTSSPEPRHSPGKGRGTLLSYSPPGRLLPFPPGGTFDERDRPEPRPPHPVVAGAALLRGGNWIDAAYGFGDSPLYVSYSRAPSHMGRDGVTSWKRRPTHH